MIVLSPIIAIFTVINCFIFSRYIVWTSENFPKGGKELGDLLERCMTTFQDQERYKNDERYAKVWLRYVS